MNINACSLNNLIAMQQTKCVFNTWTNKPEEKIVVIIMIYTPEYITQLILND